LNDEVALLRELDPNRALWSVVRQDHQAAMDAHLSAVNRGVASARNPNDFPRADHAQAALTCLDLDEYRADVRDGADARTTQFHPVAYVEFHFRTSEPARKIAIMRIGSRGECSTKVGLSPRANGLCTNCIYVTAHRSAQMRPTTIGHDHLIDT
jgi:hypothetical protein